MKYSEYQPRPDLLKDRIILITGAGDGIGRAAALSYALHGATVVLHGRTLNKLEVIYDEIEGLGAPQPAILPLQLSSASDRDYDFLVSTLEKQFGRLDGILHNAGILGERVELAHYPAEVWDDVMAVNLRAPFALTQALLPLLQKSENASVVFTSSGVGREARALWGAYSVSKVAIEAVSKILRLSILIQIFALIVLTQELHVLPCVLKLILKKIRKHYQHRSPSCRLIFI